MNLFYTLLLLLVVLSGFSENFQLPYVLHSTRVTVFPHSVLAQLGVLAPVLPQNEVFRIAPPQNEVYKIVLPQNEVYQIVLPQNEVSLTSSEVLNLTLSGVFKSVLSPNEVFKIVATNCQLLNNVKTTVSNLGVKCSKHLISILIHGGEKLCWAIRILLECLQHVLKMYTWSLSENLASVQFKCRLTGLSLKKCLFQKHDFAVCIHKLYHGYQNLCFQHLNIFSTYKNVSHM